MKLSALRSRVYRDLAEAKIGNDRVTEPDVVEALNQAYERVASETGCFVRESAVTTELGTFTYALPADMFAVRAIRFDTNTAPLVATTTKGLPFLSPTWRDAPQGTPSHYYFFDSRKLGIYPPPNKAAALKVEGFVIPMVEPPVGGIPILAADDDVPAFPANFHMLLVHDAVYTLCTRYLLDGQEAQAKAGAAKADFEALMAQFRTFYATGVSLAVGR